MYVKSYSFTLQVKSYSFTTCRYHSFLRPNSPNPIKSLSENRKSFCESPDEDNGVDGPNWCAQICFSNWTFQ